MLTSQFILRSIVMENCEYVQVETEGKTSDKESWAPFLHQAFICSGIWCCYFVIGLSMGATTVLVPQIRKQANSTDAVSTETASWLASIYGFAGMPWVPILPILSHYFGRRVPYGLICFVSLCGAILFYCSTSVTHIFISEIMTSLITAGHVPIFLVILSEFTSPKYRGVFLTLKSASFNWGVLASNTMGTFLHWKTIGILHIMCCSYMSIGLLFWPESPYWLARKGKYAECKKAFRWLQGTSIKAENDLKSIIESEKKIKKDADVDNNLIKVEEAPYKVITSKNICKPLFLCSLLIITYYTNGKIVCSIYAIDIIKQISDNETAAYTAMLILDGITVFSMYIGSALTRVFKRKKMYVASTSLGVLFLFAICLYLYLIRFSVIAENKYVTLFLLTIYSICICSGPMLLSTSICSELLPLKYRNSLACFIGILDRGTIAIVLKLSPYMFIKLGSHGSFSVFAVVSIILLTFLIKYMPETKDKTLHEIQELLVGTKHNKKDTVVDDD